MPNLRGINSPLIKSAAVLSATKYCPQSSYMTQYFVLPETRRHFVNGLLNMVVPRSIYAKRGGMHSVQSGRGHGRRS